MAPTIEQVALGIETRLKTISGLRTQEYVPDQVNPPQAFVGLPSIPEYRTTFGRGVFTIAPTITVLVSAAFARGRFQKLMSYANPTGSTSIPAAVEADRTLGGVVDECRVIDFREMNIEEVGMVGYYGGIFRLDVIAKGV